MLTRVDAVPGGLDFLFGAAAMARSPRATLRGGDLTDEDGDTLAWASTTLVGSAGQHPADLMNDPVIGSGVRRLLGPKLDDFVLSLAVASGTQILDGWLTGTGCAPHECGSRESALFLDLLSDKVNAATLRDEVATVYLSVGSKIPSNVGNWIPAHWETKRIQLAPLPPKP